MARNNELLNTGFFRRHIYAQSLGKNVVQLLKTHASSFAKFPHSPTTKALASAFMLKSPTMDDFDDVFTRIIGGDPPIFPMATTVEYYKWASSHKILNKVAVPYLSINAADDPIVQEIPTDCGENGWVAMVVTEHGGHLGWFGRENVFGGVDRWVSKPAIEFLHATASNLVHVPRGRTLYVQDGFIKEDGRMHLGCQAVEFEASASYDF